MDKAHQVLRDVFGHSSFRLSQEAVSVLRSVSHSARD